MIKEKEENAVRFIFEMCNVGDSIVHVVCNMLQSGFLTKNQMTKVLLEMIENNTVEAKVFVDKLGVNKLTIRSWLEKNRRITNEVYRLQVL